MNSPSFRFTVGRSLVVLSLCALSAAPVWSQTEPPPPPAEQAEQAEQAEAVAAEDVIAETILVAGQRPGPGLWKVSKGDHVLWVFGTYSPLPKKMEWRS